MVQLKPVIEKGSIQEAKVAGRYRNDGMEKDMAGNGRNKGRLWRQIRGAYNSEILGKLALEEPPPMRLPGQGMGVMKKDFGGGIRTRAGLKL